MNNISKTILIGLIAIFGIGFLSIPSTQAIELPPLFVEFEDKPLFNEADFKPGDSVTRWVKVINNSGQPQRIAAEAINYPGFPNPDDVPAGDLSRALSIIIREKNGSDLYGGSTGAKTLYDFYQNGETYLSDISDGNGGFKNYEFEIIFPAEKENEWQGATTTFDILIGFQGVGGGVPPGGGGGGAVLPPGLTIQYEKEFYISTTTAKISWLTSYKATSRVIYDTVDGKFDLNNLPNYGYAYSTLELNTPAATNGVTYHEVWLTDLAPATTYYFRCVSHASLAISREYSFTTLGIKEIGKIGEEIPSKGETTPRGEITPEGEIEKPSEEIGEELVGEGLEGVEEIVGEEEVEKPVLVEKKPLREIFATEGLLAAIGAIPLDWKLILIIVGVVIVGVIILGLNRKRKIKT